MKSMFWFLFQGNVEVWLDNLLTQARLSLHAVIRMASVAIKDPAFKLIEFLDTFAAQVYQQLQCSCVCVYDVISDDDVDQMCFLLRYD